MTTREDAAAVRVFPPAIPPAIPLATILAGIALGQVWPIELGFEPPRGVWWTGGLLTAAAVLALGLWSVLPIRRSGQSENPWKPTTRIIEQGRYRLSRNPMFLQRVLVCVGVAIALWNPWILLLTPLCAWLLQRLAIVPEEAYLEQVR